MLLRAMLCPQRRYFSAERQPRGAAFVGTFLSAILWDDILRILNEYSKVFDFVLCFKFFYSREGEERVGVEHISRVLSGCRLVFLGYWRFGRPFDGCMCGFV